jgi:hypothetical protein
MIAGAVRSRRSRAVTEDQRAAMETGVSAGAKAGVTPPVLRVGEALLQELQIRRFDDIGEGLDIAVDARAERGASRALG